MIVNESIVNILVDRIKNSGINPRTGEVMAIEDIKIEEYKVAVQAKLDLQ